MRINLNLEVESSKDLAKLQSVLAIFQEQEEETVETTPSPAPVTETPSTSSPEKEALEEKIELKRKAKKTPVKHEPVTEAEAEEVQAEEVQAEEVQAEEVSAPENITLFDLREEVSKRAANHREAIRSKLQELGAANTTSLDQSKYGELYAFLMTLA